MKTNIKQKTRDYLKSEGAIVGNVEFWNKYSRKSIDLFNLFDMVAIFRHSICGIQATTMDNFQAHHKKMVENPILNFWLDTDQPAYLFAWRKLKVKRGGKKYVWKPLIREYYLADIHEEEYKKWKTQGIDGTRVIWRDTKEL
jgi:hypothetical protein